MAECAASLQRRLRERVAGVRGAGGDRQRLCGGLWDVWRVQTAEVLQLPLRCLCLQGWYDSLSCACVGPHILFNIMGCLPAGWSGWGCTDDTTAQSFGRQLAAALLLTLSNLSFLPAIVVAIVRCYITEASVYVFTMFFSTVTDTVRSGDQPEVSASFPGSWDSSPPLSL